ncbi:hypothetical protein Tco_0146981 [Tanacetum coccineum]
MRGCHVTILEASVQSTSYCYSTSYTCTVPHIPAQYLVPIISCATCHHLSGATWPASRYRSHHQTTGQRRQSTVANNGGPPPDHRSTAADHRSTAADHRRTTGQRQRSTAGPSVNHRSTVVDRQSTVGSGRVMGPVKSGHGPGRDQIGSGFAIWHATWYHVLADVAADVAWRGYYPPAFRTHDLSIEILRNHMRPPALGSGLII